MRGEILGMERRRFWRDKDKLEIVMSVGINGSTVTRVAQRHEVTRQQIYAWRHDLKKKGLWSPDARALPYPLDMPVMAGILAARPTVAETSPPVAVELRLGGRRSLHFESMIDPTALSVLIRAVDRACRNLLKICPPFWDIAAQYPDGQNDPAVLKAIIAVLRAENAKISATLPVHDLLVQASR